MPKRVVRKSSQPAVPPRGMFLLVMAGVLLLAAAIVWASQASGSQQASGGAGPRLSVDQELIDFGEVQMGQPVSANFTVTNTGDETLRIVREPVVEVVEGC